MRKAINVVIIGLLFSLLAITPAQAHFGNGSLIDIPIADGLREDQVSLSYQYFNAAGKNIINLQYGTADILQAGINLETDFDEILNPYPSLKAKLLTEEDLTPAVAAGLINRSRYLVASQTIPYQDIRIHYGLGDREHFSDYVFVGASKVLNPVSISTGDASFKTPTTTIMADYNAAFNLGFNFSFDSTFELDLSGVDLFRDSRDFSFKLNFKNVF